MSNDQGYKPQHPTPNEIAAERMAAEISRPQAAIHLCVAYRTIQDWERGVTDMPPGMWKLLKLICRRKDRNYVAKVLAGKPEPYQQNAHPAGTVSIAV